MKNTLNIAVLFIGTIIGAGFASGQEIYIFFTRFGVKGIYGVILSFAVIALLSSLLLILVNSWRTKDYYQFFKHLFSQRWSYFIDLLFTIYMFAGICIMLAGAGALLNDLLKLPLLIGTLLTLICAVLILNLKMDGLFLANRIIVPTIIISILLLYLKSRGMDSFHTNLVNPQMQYGFSFSALIYASYNVTLALSILCTLGRENFSNQELVIGAVLGSLILGFLSFLIVKMELPLQNLGEMPLLEIVREVKMPILGLIVKLALWGEIFSTLIGNIYGLTQRFSKSPAEYLRILTYICCIAWPLSLFGFSKLVNLLYPLFGKIFLVLIILVIINSIRKTI